MMTTAIHGVDVVNVDAGQPTVLAATAAPSAPRSATAVPNDRSSIRIAWGNPGNVDSFSILRSTDGVRFNEIAKVNGSTTSYINNNLPLDVWYHYKIVSNNAQGSASTGIISQLLRSSQFGNSTENNNGGGNTGGSNNGGGTSAPTTPQSVVATPASSNSIRLTWADNANEDGYTVLRSTDGVNFGEIAKLSANTTSYTNTGLALNTWYHYKLVATNSAGSATTGIISQLIRASSAVGSTAAPSAATNFSASANGTNAVRVTWSDVANETGYVLYRSTDSINFSEIARLNAGSTSFTNTGLSAGTFYHYRLVAVNNYGEAATGVVSARTDANPTPQPTAPATPGGLSISRVNDSTAAVDWNDVSGATGYIIERSTNNSSFSEVGRTNGSTSYYQSTGLAANTTYYFRVRAFNNAGTSNPTNSGSIKTPAPNTGGSSSGITNKFSMSGIVMNEVNYAISDKAMKELGIKSVRLWYNAGNWTGVNTYAIDRALQYKKAGYTVVLAVVSPNVPSYAQAKTYFQNLANAANARHAVDYWEIGNEMNMSQYWKGTMKQYVEQNLKPAYEVFKPLGEAVIGGGISWDVRKCIELESYGYSKYVDYTGFHPYGESGNIVADRAAAAKAAFGGKQMIITEWNVQFVTDMAKWAKEITVAAQRLQHIAYLNYYYALETDESHVGKGGVIHPNGSKNTLFWNEVYSWLN